MKNKIIFLDIDGVLNTLNTKQTTKNGSIFIENKYILRLKQIIDRTDSKIVLISSWRLGFYDLQKKLNTINCIDYLELSEKLKQFDLEIFDVIEENLSKYDGIKRYLDKKSHLIDKYVIIDDKIDAFELSSFLISIESDRGLSTRNVFEIINKLCK